MRRKYDLFWKGNQFGYIDAGTLAWDFHVPGEDGQRLAAINRNFGGFAREIFTDTGAYAIHLDDEVDKENPGRPISLNERALLLASAVQVDIDYFSRHSSHAGGFMPFGMFGGGAPVPAADGEANPEHGVGAATGVGAVGEAGVGGAVGAGAGSIYGAAAGGAPSAAPGAAPSSPSDGNVWGDPAPPPSGGSPWADPTPPPPSGTNAWGEQPFLSDDEVANNAGESAGNEFDGFFDD
ncbi:Scramblase-domain-containing protein [Geranomyces variabilis]|nr:Scramblase-domain-containing protein [Geranomyces variabilis]